MSDTIHFGPQDGPQTDFLSSPADITIYGGARGGGKTFGLCLSPLRHIKHRMFRSVNFRRTYPQIYQEGGIWDTAQKIYPYAGGDSSGSEWQFPNGSTIAFHHMANDDDWLNWMGSQIPHIGFDQLEQFTEKQFFNMMACNRDPNGIVRPYMQATCNPEPDCWLSRFLQWWWDPITGYAIPERSGKIRWFIRKGDVIIWGNTAEELERNAEKGVKAKSVMFIAAYVEDNKALMENDPTYLATLLSMSHVERERWHKGNWKIKDSAGKIFQRQWFADKIVRQLPNETLEWARYTDLAHTPETEGEDPDWTAQVKMGKLGNICYVAGFTRWRKTSHETEQSVRATAQADGVVCKQAMEQEPAAGKSYCAHYQKTVLAGFHFQAIPSIKSKIVRAGPFSSACQAGNVFLLEGPWNAAFIDHLEAFRGDEEKNDVPDAASGCYNTLFEESTNNYGSVNHRSPDRVLGARSNGGINRKIPF